jgi:hypothetical protein
MEVKIMKKIFIATIFTVAVYLTLNQPVFAQTDGRDLGGLRDRTAIMCDPMEDPRGLRGEGVDCTGYVPTPTTSVSQPTVTPGGGGTGGVPTQTPSNGGGSSSGNDDCASGKSYAGPYCGWSPEKDKPSSDSNSSSNSNETPRIGGPGVLGLSYTGSGELRASDIMLLTGVLCLLLYIRSKTLEKKSV